MAGYIKLHRGWHDSEFFRPEPYCERAAWAWLLSNAAWKETARRASQGGVVTIQRGEIHVSLSSLASAWGWSIKRVRCFLDRLVAAEMVAKNRAQSGHSKGHSQGTAKGTGATVLTILNYTKYQGGADSEGAAEGTAEGIVGAGKGHTQEEGKEDKKEKTTHYAFFGRTIRLNANDLDRWRKRYHAIGDLEAELGSLDDWLQGPANDKARANWFHIVSGALNKKHQAAMRETNDNSVGHRGVGI